MLTPRLLLIDDISEGLQPSVVDRIAAPCEERRRDGTAMLIVEQKLDIALRLADRWAVLKRGEIDDARSCDEQTHIRILDHLSL